MPPPPADSVASRLFLAPALRTQPDRRLVALVRDGYELAFEEIVRRYRAPLERFAAAIVGSHSEDVTQDAFSKALLALRGSANEIELRPWLYRIVRNTALNDIRDSPPPTEELGEAMAGGASAAVEAERREEITDLTERLRALPETQRAAIVMRELEGLSHEEIAAALGLSGGAARQAIHRARTTLRDGVGLLLPLPLLKFLLDGGGEAAAAGAGAAAGAAGAGGSAAALGGIGAAGAAKIGVATVLVAGSVGAGVAVEQGNRSGDSTRPAATSTPLGDDSSGGGGPGRSSGEAVPGDDHGGGEAESGDDHGGRGEGEHGDGGRGGGGGDGRHRGHGSSDDSGPSASSGPGSGSRGGSDDSGSGSGSSRSGTSGSEKSGSGGGSSSGKGSGSGSGSGSSSGSGPPDSNGSTSGSSGSDDSD
jgi:RNA polymerase sigma factor (sigma-70 family)